MKTYPSIIGPNKAPHNPCYVFVKYDGQNIRCEWSRKRGWYKFGTRNRLLDEKDIVWGRSVELFKNKYGDDLERVFKTEKSFRSVDNVIVFSEFFGSKTLAGMHQPDETEWNVVLFDVNVHKKGILGPKEFLDIFGHLDVAELVFEGNMGPELIKNVREELIPLASQYEVRNEVPEGVICKGGTGHNLWMCKIKTNRYLQEIKSRYESDWIKHWE